MSRTSLLSSGSVSRTLASAVFPATLLSGARPGCRSISNPQLKSAAVIYTHQQHKSPADVTHFCLAVPALKCPS